MYSQAKVKEALAKCEESIKQERKGELRSAFELLQSAVLVFEEQLEVASKKSKDVLKIVHKINKDKLLSLKTMLEKEEQETADSEDRNMPKEDILLYTGDNLYEKDFQDSELQYKSHKLEPLPKEVELRPFHIMRRIENSWSDTMDNEGGYISCETNWTYRNSFNLKIKWIRQSLCMLWLNLKNWSMFTQQGV